MSIQLNCKIVIDNNKIIYTKWNTSLKDTLESASETICVYYNKYGQIIPLYIPIKGTIHLFTSPNNKKLEC